MFTTVKQALTDLLTDSALFASVLDFEPSQLTSFPTATVTAVSFNGEDNALSSVGAPSQLRTYTLKIRIYYGLTPADGENDIDKQAEAERQICSLVDQVNDIIMDNRNLKGACDYAAPIGGEIGETEREQVVKYAEITIEAKVYKRSV